MNLCPLTHDKPTCLTLFLFFPLTSFLLLPTPKLGGFKTIPFLIVVEYKDELDSLILWAKFFGHQVLCLGSADRWT